MVLLKEDAAYFEVGSKHPGAYTEHISPCTKGCAAKICVA